MPDSTYILTFTLSVSDEISVDQLRQMELAAFVQLQEPEEGPAPTHVTSELSKVIA